MKIAIKLLFLLMMARTFTMLAMAPEDSAQQENTLTGSQLLQRNVQLSTEFLQLFTANLEERLKSLQELQKSCSVSKLRTNDYSPETARSFPDSDIKAYWNAIQGTKKVLEQIAECTDQTKSSIINDHIVTIRELERAKCKTTQ